MRFALLLVLAPLLAAAEDPFAAHMGERWFSILMGGKKAGWRHWTLTHDEKNKAYVSRDVALIRIKTDGEFTETRNEEVWTFEAAAPYRLRSLMATTKGPQESVAVEAWRADGHWHVQRRVSGERATQRKSTTAQTLDGFLRPNLAARDAAKPGATWKVTGFSIDEQRDRTEALELLSVGPRTRRGVTTTVYHFRGVQHDKTRVDYWLDPRGRVLRVKVGALLELVRSDRDSARRLGQGFDRLHDALIATPPLGPPEHVVRLRLRVLGYPAKAIPRGVRQRVVSIDDEGVLLDIRRREYVATKTSPDGAAAARALEDTPELSIKDPRIVALAKKLTAEKEGLPRAAALLDWVYRSLDKTYAADASSALTVLENRRGDCTEHALLFVALARAVGIPAREVSGLVHIWDEQSSGFVYHSWVEVLLDGGWHEMDPSWGQQTVDATHVRLVGDPREEGVLTNAQGKIRLTLVREGQAAERLTLRDGRALVGRMTAVTPAALRFRTPTAELLVPRASIASLDMRGAEPRGVVGRRFRDVASGLAMLAPEGWRVVTGKAISSSIKGAIAEFRRDGDGGAAALVILDRSKPRSAEEYATATAARLGLTQAGKRVVAPFDVTVLEGRGYVYHAASVLRDGTALRVLAWCRQPAAKARAAEIAALLRSAHWTGRSGRAAGQ